MSCGTRGHSRSQHGFAYGTITRYGSTFQKIPLPCCFVTPCERPHNPAVKRRRFRLVPFRSPLLWESLLFSSPGVTKMVQFTPFALTGLCIQPGVTRHYPRRVAPFGNLRINGRLRLPEAYRSLPRPSSPLRAKASPMRP